MASSGCRGCTRPLAALLALASFAALAACGARATTPASASAPTPAPAASQTQAYEVGVELPPGRGRELLVAECVSCHTLGALELFKAFYTRDDWHALVLTMVEHGAAVDATGVETISDYLAEHFSPTAP